MKNSNTWLFVIFPRTCTADHSQTTKKPRLPKEDETLSRGTTSIYPHKPVRTSCRYLLPKNISESPLCYTALSVFRLFFLHSNILRCNRRSCQSLSACQPVFPPAHAKSSSSLPLQSHLPSVFPHFLSANHSIAMRYFRHRTILSVHNSRNEWKFLCKVPIDVLSFSACFSFLLYSD